ncbi:MAG: acyltransferase family protein [bacterium]|nr:acyltransferase family protein [bacterium]MCM1499434.1 acyltransferase family protein [Clostridium sp.]
MGNDREKAWDILKGFTICCVLIGHLIQYMSLGKLDYTRNRLYLLIYSFHMPLFMFMAGYFFKKSMQKYSFKNLLIRQAKGLLIPLFVWNTIFYYFWYAIHMLQGKEEGPVLRGWLYSMRGLWFLSSLFICSLIVLVVHKALSDLGGRY